MNFLTSFQLKNHSRKSYPGHICTQGCRELRVHLNNLVAWDHLPHRGYLGLLVINSQFAPLQPKMVGMSEMIAKLSEVIAELSKCEYWKFHFWSSYLPLRKRNNSFCPCIRYYLSKLPDPVRKLVPRLNILENKFQQ